MRSPADCSGKLTTGNSGAFPVAACTRENETGFRLLHHHDLLPMSHPQGIFFTLAALAGFSAPAFAEEFSSATPGPLTASKSAEGAWSAAAGNAEIHAGKGGAKMLRLTGGETGRSVDFTPAADLAKGGTLAFSAERWTNKAPFAFAVLAIDAAGKTSVAFDGAKSVVTGRLTKFSVELPAGTKSVRFTSTSPAGGGVLIDDVVVEPAKSMAVRSVEVTQPVIPALIRKRDNPVVSLKITAAGALAPVKLTRVAVTLDGTTDLADIAGVRLVSIGREKHLPSDAAKYAVFGDEKKPARELVFEGALALAPGDNEFRLLVELASGASLDRRIDAGITAVAFSDGKTLTPATPEPAGSQRIGVAVRLCGDDNAKGYRIPGLATTNKGTLIGVYDIRYNHHGDLPANIDVGMSRSTDGGQNWEPMRVAIDMGVGPKDGVGDPAVLVDPKTGRIWVAALWSHGNRAWGGSGKGLTPDETGQLVLAHSDDDGLTWSKPINITNQVKKPDWHMFFNGPGAGIALKDGTLVFPAQYQDGDLNAAGKKKGTPYSTLIYSRDGGETWHAGTGVKSDTTEAQVAELADGSIMINARDNRGGSRTVGVTKDLGKTWTLHATDRKALPEPVCMASLLRVDSEKYGPLFVFSNPATKKGRYDMSVKVSKDFGSTWPAEFTTLYDSRHGYGYSCLAPVGKDAVGVLYEGRGDLYYLRFPLAELLGDKK